MNTNEYLERINYRGALNPSADVLAALQEAHLLAVPFENLDIHTGTTIVLETAALFRKIVEKKRGGFCYELNSLFHALLRRLGFRVTLASGRVFDADSAQYGPEFDHMLLLAMEGDRTWLVDVGFGDFSMRPLRFVPDAVQSDATGDFIIEKDSGEYFRVSRYSASTKQFIPQYIFSTRERTIEDFTPMCVYHQTSPDSHFTQKRLCTIATRTGRVTLTDAKLSVTVNGAKNEFPIHGEREFNDALSYHFGITL